MKRVLISLFFGCLVVPVGCDRCNTEVLDPNIDVFQDDVFDQKQAAEVDVLWMVDNSGSMAAEQFKVAERFNLFFNQLLTSAVDYHIGVVTSDPAEGGVLRQYNGPAVDGCANCRFITKDVPCPNPEVDISDLTDETEIESVLSNECPAQLVFRKLVTVGINGTPNEQGFPQVAEALGLKDVDPATGVPLNNPPPENAGFVRQSASLYIVFVSDEEEGDKDQGTPIRYYQRLFESLKGAGNENKVAVAAITGFPLDDESLPPINEVCGVLETTFDGNLANDDPRAAGLVEALRTFQNGCVDLEDEAGGEVAFAETGGRYIQLACRTGGVVANMCEADYNEALDALGANAAGLKRKFTLSKSQLEIEWGTDCQPDTDDDPALDCDDDGDFAGPLDGPLCVTAQDIDASAPGLVPRDDNEGWRLEGSTNSIRFDGSFLPAPGTQVIVRYKVRKNACSGA